MKKKRWSSAFLLISLTLILFIIIGSIPNSSNAAYPPPPSGGGEKLPAPTPSVSAPAGDQRLLSPLTNWSIYLPLVMQPYQSKECGTEIGETLIPGSIYYQLLIDLPCKWLRYNPGGIYPSDLGFYGTYVQAGPDPDFLLKVFDDNGTANQIQLMKSGGKEPILVFMGNYPATCTPLPTTEYAQYALFVKKFAEKYDIKYVEIWNEVDFSNAFPNNPNLFGCWGPAYTQEFINLLTTVRSVIPQGSAIKIGTSFGLTEPEHMQMLQTVMTSIPSGTLDFLGIHHYVYSVPNPEDIKWESLSEKITAVRAIYPTGVLWLTETNLLKEPPDHGVSCFNPTEYFFNMQGNYINLAMHQVLPGRIDSVFAYSLKRWNWGWKCSALLDPNYIPLPSYWNLRYPPLN